MLVLKLFSAFLLVILGQGNILAQKQNFLLFELRKIQNKNHRQKLLPIFLKKQNISRFREFFKSRIKKISKRAGFFAKFLTICNLKNFRVKNHDILFNFNAIKPNWFGCWLFSKVLCCKIGLSSFDLFFVVRP